MSDKPDAVVTETDLDAPPDKVWRALTEPALLDAWLADDAGGDGGRELLEADPGRSARYRWQAPGDALASEIRFDLTASPDGGSHLRIVHTPVVVSLAKARTRFRPRAAQAGGAWRMAA